MPVLESEMAQWTDKFGQHHKVIVRPRNTDQSQAQVKARLDNLVAILKGPDFFPPPV